MQQLASRKQGAGSAGAGGGTRPAVSETEGHRWKDECHARPSGISEAYRLVQGLELFQGAARRI